MRLYCWIRIKLLYLLFIVIGIVTACHADAAWSGKVVAVRDGDSLEVLKGGRAVQVRIFGIDCPEWGQPYGAQAKEFTASLCFNQIVTVRPVATDQYGRTVAVVILSDQRNLGAEIIKAGYAWHLKKYSHSEQLAALEQEARKAKKGLWQDKHPVPPWNWRIESQHDKGNLMNSPRSKLRGITSIERSMDSIRHEIISPVKIEL